MPIQVSLDRALMQHLADLARLHVPTERQAVLRQRLECIVAAFSTLQDAEDGHVDAAKERQLELRDDLATPPLPLTTVLANAPQHAGGTFVVPRVIDA